MLILYSGSDAYRIRQATDKIVATYRKKYGSVLSVSLIDCAQEDGAQQLERSLKYPSFFEEKKMIITHNAAHATMTGLLKSYHPQDMDDIVLIATQDTSQGPYDKKALVALAKVADHAELCEPLTGTSLASWVREYCKERGTDIDTAALTLLLQRVPDNTRALSNELEKLCAYARKSAIDAHAVQLLTPAQYEHDEWGLSNAIAANDKRKAIVALWKRLTEGAPEQLLLGSLAAGIRNLSAVQDLHSRRTPSAAIAKLSGLHPFVVSKTIRGAAGADRTKLHSAHSALARLDRWSKDGRADATDGLFSILLSL